MRFLLTLLAFVALTFSTQRAEAYELPKPQLIAVYVYADWCPNCKILSPQWAQARKDGDFDNQPVLFVTLNLTDKPTIHQSILQAQALGIAGWFQPQGSSTGYVAILDATSKKELARFDRTATSDAMTKKLTTLLK